MKNYYQTLELDPNCTNEQIKSAYRKYAKYYHPDKHQNSENKDFFSKKFVEIKEAYDILIDEQTRKKHDEYHNLNSKKHNTQATPSSPSSSTHYPPPKPSPSTPPSQQNNQPKKEKYIPKKGEIHFCTVQQIFTDKVFVELHTDPRIGEYLHISEIAWGKIKNIRNVLQVGKITRVKIMDIGVNGQLHLSRKVLLPQPDSLLIGAIGYFIGAVLMLGLIEAMTWIVVEWGFFEDMYGMIFLFMPTIVFLLLFIAGMVGGCLENIMILLQTEFYKGLKIRKKIGKITVITLICILGIYVYSLIKLHMMSVSTLPLLLKIILGNS